MPAEKKNKSQPVKKTPKGGAVKKSPAKPKNSGSAGNNTAFFVLIIIVLITIIVLMTNRFFEKGGFVLPRFSDLFTPSEKIFKPDMIIPGKKEPDKSGDSITKEQLKDEGKKESDSDRDEKITAVQKDVRIYLLKLDEKTEKIYLSSVKRSVSEKDILTTSMKNLIAGPTSRESDRGYITAVPKGLRVRGISIRGRTAEIDFNSAIEQGATGDILLKRVQQIVYTATQFENVDSIIIKINGQRRKSMGSDGFSIGGPLKR